MNGMIISLIAMYAFAAVIMTVCVLRDMHRSLLRAGVSLGLAVLSVPLAILLTHSTLDRLTLRLLHMIDLDVITPLTEAFPSLEGCAVALVHMVVASEIYSMVLLILMAVFGMIAHVVCHVIEQKKPALAKKSKPIGAAIGAAFGIVMVVALMAPTAGYAAEAPEIVHILGEYEQITHEGSEEMSDKTVTMQHNAQKAADTALLKVVRALGGKAIFRATTAVEIDGVETDLHSEFHSLDALGEQLAVLTAVPVAEYGEEQYKAVEQLADMLETSALLRVLSAEGLSSLSHAWLNGEDFLGVPKPETDVVTDVTYDILLRSVSNTTKETVVEDVRMLGQSLVTASKAVRLFRLIEAGAQGSSLDTSSVLVTLDDAATLLREVVASEEGRRMATELALGVIGMSSLPEQVQAESEQYLDFARGVTDLFLSDALERPVQDVVEDVKDIRDATGLALSDELCEKLVNDVMSSPYAPILK